MYQDPNATVTADGTTYDCYARVWRRSNELVDTTAFEGNEESPGVPQGWGGRLRLEPNDATAVFAAQEYALNDRDFHVEPDSVPEDGILSVSGKGDPPAV